MTRRPAAGDPTARAATTNALTLSPRARESVGILIEMVATLDLSDAEVRRWTGKTRSALYTEYRRKVSFNHHTDVSVRVLEEIQDLADGLPPELKAAVHAVEQSMLRPCERCGELRVPPPSRAGGQPRRFCSNACRQAAHRQRTRRTTD
ncbi:hypothetical protein ADK60_14050 [Streptomyces sp. XY431]|uniref:hypothetical protein n=1 Tax=Streptomyces sp. XY431 TaxID=1415562 RepID=UPI0006ADBA0D|nr:hypothetical protein [Streptomyces sp. XY431]KOV32371.1 hypothetical protein ADK60_14050 [Streptomyces sp. XY431]